MWVHNELNLGSNQWGESANREKNLNTDIRKLSEYCVNRTCQMKTCNKNARVTLKRVTAAEPSNKQKQSSKILVREEMRSSDAIPVNPNKNRNSHIHIYKVLKNIMKFWVDSFQHENRKCSEKSSPVSKLKKVWRIFFHAVTTYSSRNLHSASIWMEVSICPTHHNSFGYQVHMVQYNTIQ